MAEKERKLLLIINRSERNARRKTRRILENTTNFYKGRIWEMKHQGYFVEIGGDNSFSCIHQGRKIYIIYYYPTLVCFFEQKTRSIHWKIGMIMEVLSGNCGQIFVKDGGSFSHVYRGMEIRKHFCSSIQIRN